MAYQAQINIKTTGLAGLNKINASVDRINKAIIQINKGGSKIKGGKEIVKINKQELEQKKNILKVETDIANQLQRQKTLRGKGGAGGKSTGGTGVAGSGLGSRFASAGQSAIISGAFPLLFGQGPLVGAAGAIGGGAGALFGGQMGGFAGGLAATSAVTAIQNFSVEISKLGQALNERTKDVQAVVQSLGVAGTQFEENIQVLQKLGLEEEAFAAARNKMIDLIGNDGVEAVTNFGKDFQELGNQFAKIMTLMKSKFAEFVEDSGILKFLGTRVERNALKGQAEKTGQFDDSAQGREIQKLLKTRQLTERFGGLSPKDREELILNITNQERGSGFGGVINDQDEDKARKIINDLIVAEQQLINTRKEGIRLDESAKSIVTGKVDAINKEIEFKKTLLPLSKEEREVELAIKSIVDNIKSVKGEEVEIDKEAIRKALEKNQVLDKQLDLTKDIGSNFELIGQSIASGVSNNLTAAIMQTKTLGDAAKSILNDLANTLVRLGVNTILGSFLPGFGSLPSLLPKARGGPVNKGGNFLVGEKGPELFVPRRSGTIVPNDKLGGGSTNISVNVDASGSSVQGDEQQSKELGKAISAAIQSELLKQRRPGGLLR